MRRKLNVLGWLVLLSLAWACFARTAFAAQSTKEKSSVSSGASGLAGNNPANAEEFFRRGRRHEAEGELKQALADFDQALRLRTDLAPVYQHRGTVHFRSGHIEQAVADFNRFLELRPDQEPYHWQRGIAFYYAGRFEEGRKQFELHQTVNPNDVENAVWHFLCVSRQSSVEKARASLIPIEEDRRVPMMEIYALFAGRRTPEEVLKAAEGGGTTSPEEKQGQRFYAHLYVGLYHEVLKNPPLAAEHIQKAAALAKGDNYMGDVARVHADLLRRAGGK